MFKKATAANSTVGPYPQVAWLYDPVVSRPGSPSGAPEVSGARRESTNLVPAKPPSIPVAGAEPGRARAASGDLPMATAGGQSPRLGSHSPRIGARDSSPLLGTPEIRVSGEAGAYAEGGIRSRSGSYGDGYEGRGRSGSYGNLRLPSRRIDDDNQGA